MNQSLSGFITNNNWVICDDAQLFDKLAEICQFLLYTFRLKARLTRLSKNSLSLKNIPEDNKSVNGNKQLLNK